MIFEHCKLMPTVMTEYWMLCFPICNSCLSLPSAFLQTLYCSLQSLVFKVVFNKVPSRNYWSKCYTWQCNNWGKRDLHTMAITVRVTSRVEVCIGRGIIPVRHWGWLVLHPVLDVSPYGTTPYAFMSRVELCFNSSLSDHSNFTLDDIGEGGGGWLNNSKENLFITNNVRAMNLTSCPTKGCKTLIDFFKWH